MRLSGGEDYPEHSGPSTTLRAAAAGSTQWRTAVSRSDRRALDERLAANPGVVKRRGHVHVYERSRDATATCCAVSVSPGLIPMGSHRPRAARPAARQRSLRGHRARERANSAVGTVMGRSSAAEICLAGPFAGRTD